MFKRLFASPINAAKDKVNDYIALRLESMKIGAVQKASPIVSGILIGVFTLFFVLLLLVFLGIGFAIWIGDAIGSTIGGYMIMAGVCLLLIIILFMLSGVIKRAVGNAMAKML